MSFSISGGRSIAINDGFIGNADAGNISAANIIPKMHDLYNLGSSTCKYNQIYSTNINGQVATSSNINNKKDIQPIEDGLSVVMKLQPKSFKYRDGTSGRVHVGFIAQECKDLFCPNWAAYVENGDEIGLRYTEFISLNTRAIQQLNKRLEDFSQQVSRKLSTDFTIVEDGGNQSELNVIYDRLSLIEASLTQECIERVNNVRNDFDSRLESKANECKSRASNLYNLITNEVDSKLESNVNSRLSDECKSRVSNLYNQITNEVDNKLESNVNSRLSRESDECKSRVSNLYNQITNEVDNKLESNVNSRLSRESDECKSRVNTLYNNLYKQITNELDSKLEIERKLKEEKSREIEIIINNFQVKFNEQISELIEKVNLLICKCNEFEKVKLHNHVEIRGEIENSINNTIQDQMCNLVDKVNFLISKCDDVEMFKDKYGTSLTEHSEQIELILNFEKSFRQEMFDLVGRVDMLANQLEIFKNCDRERDLIVDLVEKVNLLSGDMNNIRESHRQSLHEQMEVNELNIKTFRQQMLDLMEKVNLLGNDLEVIKESVTQSSKEQKSEELELINKLIEKINMLSLELQTIKENQIQSLQEHKADEMELINGLMEKVNSLTSDLETFRDNVKQVALESKSSDDNIALNFENKFREQMVNLIDKVNSLVLRCNELDVKLNNIPKNENKIELEDSDSCGSSMMETLQERLYKTEQLLSKQDKMIKKLVASVNVLLKANDNK
jgi:hypothetical protein